MHRDLEEIYKDEQKEVIFIPENYVPRMPRAVKTVKEFEDQKEVLNDYGMKVLGISGSKAGNQVLKNIIGDHTEWELYDDLKTYLTSHVDQEKVVLFGPCFKTPSSDRTKVEEHDVLIISKKDKTCICIESKHSLSSKSINSSCVQLKGMQQLNETEATGLWACCDQEKYR